MCTGLARCVLAVSWRVSGLNVTGTAFMATQHAEVCMNAGLDCASPSTHVSPPVDPHQELRLWLGRTSRRLPPEHGNPIALRRGKEMRSRNWLATLVLQGERRTGSCGYHRT